MEVGKLEFSYRCNKCGSIGSNKDFYHFCLGRNQMEKFELDELDNDELQQQAKNLHGALYHRINRLQRDLNIAKATLEAASKRIKYLEDHSTTLVPKSRLMDMFSEFIDQYREDKK